MTSDRVKLYVHDLWPVTSECGLCGTDTSGELWLPMWNGMIVPNEMMDSIDWGGIPVCRECHSNPPESKLMKRK